MSAAVRSAVATASPNNSSVTSIAVSLPAGVQDGDYLLMAIFTWGLSGTTTQPSGWTTVIADFTNGASGAHTVVYGRVASSEPSSYTVTVKNGRQVAVVYALTGVNATTPIDVTSTATATGTTQTAPSVTASAATLLICFFDGATAAGVTGTPWTGLTAGMTADASISTTSATLTLNTMLGASKTLSAGGATGAKSATQNSTGNGCGISIVLNAPPPPPSVGTSQAVIIA